MPFKEILDTFQGEVPVVSCLEGGYDTEVLLKKNQTCNSENFFSGDCQVQCSVRKSSIGSAT